MSDISIHAPVKGATLALDLVEELRPDFNPRSREGSDPVEPPCTRWPHHFNPRSREGSDLVSRSRSSSDADFNPRSREGSDQPKRYLRPLSSGFQSTLP